MTDGAKIGRLALRVEGAFWNAYYAAPDTMRDAILIGSIAMGLVARSEERKRAFMALMRECVGDVVEERTGQRPLWPDEPQAAPEHERSGNS